MKKVFVLVLMLILMLLVPVVAVAESADSWNPPGPTYDNPPDPESTSDQCLTCHDMTGDDDYGPTVHGDYVTGGDECEICHSPHKAGDEVNSYKLLRSISKNAACDYCHLGSGAKAVLLVYTDGGGNIVKTGLNGHEIDFFSGGIPDSTDGLGGSLTLPDDELDCMDCHSVHGAKTIPYEVHFFGSGVKARKMALLKEDPAGNGGQAIDKTSFCADCHNKNYDTEKNLDSHVMTADGSHSISDTNTCTSCHSVPSFHYGDFPHTSPGEALLKQDTSRDSIDDVCLDCHGGSIKKVGSDY